MRGGFVFGPAQKPHHSKYSHTRYGNQTGSAVIVFQKNLLFDLTDKACFLHHVLVFHGDADQIVPVENARNLLESMQPPKHGIIQKNGDHPMSSPVHQSEFEARTMAWFKQIFDRSGTA